MPLWKCIIAYDGTPYRGWQIQPSLPTVQGTLAAAIRHLTGEDVLPQGSGRTDTGVHALGQVASFALSAPIPGPNLHRALNRALPASIRVLSVESAEAGFHARHSALRKTYEYRIFPRLRHAPRLRQETETICPPMLAPFVWDCPWPLDLSLMQQAATAILGEHDFTSFAASDPDLAARTALNTDRHPAPPESRHSDASQGRHSDPDPEQREGEGAESPHFAESGDNPNRQTQILSSNIRRIDASTWMEQNGLYIYRVTGSGFLHHMVRNLVGTFVDIGAHRTPEDSIPALLAARDRSAAGPTAPARGLFLIQVDY